MQIQHATPTLSIRDIGQFTIKSGAIRFTDPCYANDTWCKGSMPAANGAYQAQIGFFRDNFDARNLREAIQQLHFAKEFTAKYQSSDFRYSFQSYVSKARDHGNWGGEFQSYHKLLELIAEIKDDEEKRLALEEMAKFSIEWFEPKYTTKEEHYWGKDLWILFELSSALSRDTDVRRFNRGAWLYLQKIKEAQDDEKLSKEERDALIEQLEGYLAEETISEAQAYDDKIKEMQDAYDAGKPWRTHWLRVKHESIEAFTPFEAEDWQYNDKFDVGVDSGQAGFFDEEWFTGYANEHKDNERSEKWEKIYDMLCALSSDGDSYRNSNDKKKEQGGTFEFGANSHTAWGDGSAPMFYRLNESGEVIEAVYAYDVKDEEDEEEEDAE